MTLQPLDHAGLILSVVVMTLAAAAAIAALAFGIHFFRNAAAILGAAFTAASVITGVALAAVVPGVIGRADEVRDTYIAAAEKAYGLNLTRDDIVRLDFPDSAPKKQALYGKTVTTADVNGLVADTEIALAWDGEKLILGTLTTKGVFIELDRK